MESEYMKKFFGIAIIFFALAACMPAFSVYETTDKLHPDVIVLDSTYMKLKGVALIDQSVLLIKPQCIYKGKKLSFDFSLYYSGRSWMLMDNATFLIDGKPQTYNITLQPRREAVNGDNVAEIATLDVPESLFKDLEHARALSIRVRGLQRVVDGTVSPEFIANLNRFYAAATRIVK
jgi:hypothetical protein